MSGARGRFQVVNPDWGQTHLSLDAVVAYVDDELTDAARARAREHLDLCPECTAEVVSQGQARSALRSAGGPSLPSSLLSSLRAIPQYTELPAPPAGLAMTADGRLVSVVRHEPEPSATPSRGVLRRASSRRVRLGAGAAVSGLALGALAFGAPAVPSGVPAAGPQADRGVFGGSPFGGAVPALDARLGVGSAPVSGPAAPLAPAATERRLDGGLAERLDRSPAASPVDGPR
jgi:anti-sigma factor RsiW